MTAARAATRYVWSALAEKEDANGGEMQKPKSNKMSAFNSR